MSEDKSIAEEFGILNKALFPKDTDYAGPDTAAQQFLAKLREAQDVLEVVGHCPECGSPLYGKKMMRTTDPYAPGVRRTCSCDVAKMRTK